MDLAMMLSGEKRDEGDGAPPPPKRARPDPPSPTPYSDLQRAVHNALENKTAALSTSDKVALALEVLRARQLELDLAQARNNIEALVTKSGSAPRTLRAVIPASTVKGLPVGTPVDIAAGKFLLSPTTNDPQALFLTLELQSFGQPRSLPQHNSTDPTLPPTPQSAPGRPGASGVAAVEQLLPPEPGPSKSPTLDKQEPEEPKPV